MSFSSGFRRALAPLVPLYRTGLARRERRLADGREPVRKLSFPVISIGNLSTGGAGKTPLTIALARTLKARGVQVDVLSRGYGRSGRAVGRVRLDGAAAEFGDEPLLIAREAEVPVYVSPQRFDAGVLAESELGSGKRGLHLLDDGFQHRQLAREIDIVLLNRQDWQDGLLPAGNLREERSALRRASVIALPSSDPELEIELRSWGWAGPVWKLRRRMEIPALRGPVVAFCGIARPEQFFEGLEAAGVQIARRLSFGDHHRYTPRDLHRLSRAAQVAGAGTLMTTEKDEVRLGALRPWLPLSTVGLRTEIEDEPGVVAWLMARIAGGVAAQTL